MDSLFGMGARGVVSAAACIVLASWFVGAGLHLFLVRLGFALRGAAFTVGLGLMSAVFLIEMGYFLVGNVFALLVPGVLASLGSSAFAIVQAIRGHAGTRDTLRTLVPTWTDWLTGVATLLVLYPLIRLGLVYYTDFINDFPNYAASAEQWWSTSGVGPDFLHKHPDNFGRYQLFRAELEKPTSTATFVFGTLVTGVPGYALLGPITVVTVLLLIGTVASVIERVFGCRAFVATAAALVPALSIIPMSRLHDAQVGQAIAVAFLAVLLYASVVLVDAPDGRQIIVAVTVAGMLLATTVGANPTLILGAGISWGALALWLAHRTQTPWRLTLTRFAGAGVVATLFSIPAIDGYRISLREQTGGAQGYDIPLPSPLAAVGLQLDLNDVAGTGQTLVAWAMLATTLIVSTVLLARQRSYWVTVGLAGAVIVNGALIMLKTSTDNYAAHKWEATVIAIVTPFLLARVVSLVPADRRRIAEAGLVVLAAASAVVSWRASDDVPIKVPLPVFELAESPLLADLDVVNVDLGDIYENSIAAMAVPSDQVVLSGDSYAEPTTPVGDLFVLDAGTAQRWGAVETAPLGADYVLASVDLTVTADMPVMFGSAHPESARFLYGRWHPPEPSGVWTKQRYNRLAFDVPPDLRDQDVDIILHGTRLAGPDMSRELIVRLGSLDGTAILNKRFESTATRDVRMTVPRDVIEAGNGRIVLHLDTPAAIRANELGFDDNRVLGFLLERLTVTGAG